MEYAFYMTVMFACNPIDVVSYPFHYAEHVFLPFYGVSALVICHFMFH